MHIEQFHGKPWNFILRVCRSISWQINFLVFCIVQIESMYIDPFHICMLDNNERLLVLENSLHGVEKICTWLFYILSQGNCNVGKCTCFDLFVVVQFGASNHDKIVLANYTCWMVPKIPHSVDLHIEYVVGCNVNYMKNVWFHWINYSMHGEG